MSELWLEVTLPVPVEKLDGVCDTLTANGMTGLVVEEEGDFLRFLEQNRQYWDYVDEDLSRHMKGASRVKFYVPDNEEGQRRLRQYLAGLEQYEPQMVSLREEDWATSWQKYYQPIPVGKRVYIVPEWMGGQSVPEGRVALYLNPGLTFGTGSHPTTQLCLELLEEVVSGGEMALDLGCGSGILAIAALRLGVDKVVGVDIDPKAVDVAYENAGMNGIGKDRLTVLAGNVLGDKKLAAKLNPGKNKVVLANIVADVIIPLSAVAGEFLTEDGVFLTSGIIDTRADEVAAAIEANGFVITRRLERSGWCAFRAERRRETAMKLVFPNKNYEAKAREFIAEFYEYGSELAGTGSLDRYLKEATYDQWLEKVSSYIDVANLPADKIPGLTYFFVREEDDHIVGMINIRLALNDFLRNEAGHIGYCIRPTERRKGYGTQLLRAGLAVCRRVDINEVIVTCDKINLGSAGVIQNCGGVLDAEFYSGTFDETLQRYVISPQG